MYSSDEIVSEYNAKMRDATEREEQLRKRIQPDNTPTDVPTSPSIVSSASSLSFHTPTIGQSPNIVTTNTDTKANVASSPPMMEKTDSTPTVDIMPLKPKEDTQTMSKPIEKPIIRYTATEETTQEEYRRTVKFVPSNILKSTIQNYMMDHNLLDEAEGK